MDILDLILAAATRHGQAGDPDMEVGDLQQLTRDLWSLLTPEQRQSFPTSGRVIDWSEFINDWDVSEGGDNGEGNDLRRGGP